LSSETNLPPDIQAKGDAVAMRGRRLMELLIKEEAAS
jgi:hypothetical protein